MYVVELGKQNQAFSQVMTDPRIRALTPLPIVQASGNQSGALKGGDGAGLREVMADPQENAGCIRCQGRACALCCFARSGACPHTGSEEVSGRDQQQNPQSRGRGQKLYEIASPSPKISRSRSAFFICRLGTARQVLRLLNILVQGYTPPKQARRKRKSWPIPHRKSRRPCAMRSNRT